MSGTDSYHLSEKCDSFSPPSPTMVLPAQLMAPDEEVLWFLSPLFRHLCIDDVCPQGPGGLRLTEIIKSKYVSSWRRMCVWYANTGFRGTCGEEKMLRVLVGSTRFNLKRSGWWWSDGNMKGWTSEVFGASAPPPTHRIPRVKGVFLVARFKSHHSSKLGDKTL